MKKKWLLAVLLPIAIVLWAMVSIYPELLWFGNQGFSSVFWTMFISKLGFGALVWLTLIVVVIPNLIMAKRLSRAAGGERPQGSGPFALYGLSGNTLNILLAVLILIASLVIASKGSSHWDMVLRYLFQEPFGGKDPVLDKSLSFYVFSLPFWIFIRDGLMVLLVFAAAITVIWYLKEGAVQVIGELSQTDGMPTSIPKLAVSEKAKRHLVFLGGLMAVLMAWGYHLKVYVLLYSESGPIFGAAYTDIHFKIWAFRALIVITLAFAAALFFNLSGFRKKQLLVSLGIWVAAVLLLSKVLPLVVQQFVVKPNEFEKEAPYIAYNIEHTRQGYNLDKIEEVDFEVNTQLSKEDIDKHDVTIENIRVWDERPLLQTYRQIQSIRLYYDFNNVDVGRYMIRDRYRQVMLAARELDVDQLPSQADTWVNRHLSYTHGYGLASSPVNEVTREGLPRLFVKDLPPAFEPGLEVTRPEIYYGESTDQYVLVKTDAREFDYPKGDKNVYSVYEGRGGVQIDSFLKRLVFAAEFLDPQILFTRYLTPQSRIMYRRKIPERAATIAPFLNYDKDPYLVISEGRLYWVLDAYTSSNMYPYSARSRVLFKKAKMLNYIRNSVKVTVDAYNGEVRFYQVDTEDPILRTYAAIFPDLLRPFEEMPEDLKKHVRYPKDLFKIQADMYARYHMQDAQVFYNQEDLWELPNEMYGDSQQEMEPYYIIIKLPQGEKEEFLLMLPFTPSKKDNMIGWLAARSDLPNYGNLFVYKLPKEKLVYGPMQIEARVDQQTDISRELSLWGQRGSRVIRGNLLVIPVSDTFIYIEPVYLQAKQEGKEPVPQTQQTRRGRFRRSQGQGGGLFTGKGGAKEAALPELKRVIAGFSNRIAMDETLDAALRRVLSRTAVVETQGVPAPTKAMPVGNLAQKALEHYSRAKQYLKQENWAGYGRELDQLENILEQLSREEPKD